MRKELDLICNSEKCSVELIKTCDEVLFYKFKYASNEEAVPKEVCVRWQIPSIGIVSTWNPITMFNRALRTVTTAGISLESRSYHGAPVQALIAPDGKNKITFAVSDAITPMTLNTQIDEEGIEMTCEIKFFTYPVRKMKEYEAIIRIDFSDVPYYEAIANVGKWWREDLDYGEASVPDFARDALYSTWYSYHHGVSQKEIVEQCKRAYKFGMKTMILDDGWNMSDKEHRYFGDWVLHNPNINDLAEMSDEIHKIGMRMMLWFGVPFISRNSEIWERLGEFVLNDKAEPWCLLDPRYKEVRDYTLSLFERAVRNWNLDGVKLDFINAYALSDYSKREDSRRDFESLEEAVACLMEEIGTRLRAIKPDILIEFHTPYLGPKAMAVSNIMHVSDCANDALYDRVGAIDIRLLTGKTAVHADMIAWNKNETPEGVARLMASVLFCVPQISVKLEEQNEEQLSAMKFYIDFYNENKDALLCGKLMPLNPEANFAVVIGEKDNKAVAVCYSKNFVTLGQYEKLSIVNATEEGVVVLNNAGLAYSAQISIYDCKGNLIKEEKIEIKNGLNSFEIPSYGLMKIK